MNSGDKPVCLLFGASGHVGTELLKLLADDFRLHAPDRGQCDLSNPEQIRKTIRECSPALIINACAYTAVDAAEHEPDMAFAVNGYALEVIAQEAREVQAAVVHYSTVFVFDGKADFPYRETDAANPVNAYGRSKLLGERLLSETLGGDYPFWVLRPSWSYSPHSRGNNFLRHVLAKSFAKDPISIVSDESGVPVSAALIAEVTLRLLEARPPSGVYHVSCSGRASRFDYAKFVIEQARNYGFPVQLNDEDIRPITSEQFNAQACRPKYILMNCEKLENALSMQMPDWHEGVEKTIKTIAEKENT